MSDQQGNEAPVSVAVGMEEVKQVVLPGAQLAAQRQAKGWSVEHAASQLKFATRQVIALEEDNYAALPGAVIVRGFVRAYAKLLGLDANALVALLPQEGAAPDTPIVPQKTLSTPFSESPLPLGNRHKIPAAMIAAGIVIVALVGAAAAIRYTDVLGDVPQISWLKQSRQAEDSAAQAQADAAELPPEVQDGSDKNKGDKVEVADVNAPRDVVAKSSDAAEPASTQVQTTAPVAAVTAVPVTTPAVPPAPVATATPAAKPVASVAQAAPVAAHDAPVQAGLSVTSSKDLLRLTFREDSWIEIRRGDKSVMISRLLKAGTTESFDISEPVTLVVGNAGGVDATLRGSKLDLQTGTSSNVARLSLK